MSTTTAPVPRLQSQGEQKKEITIYVRQKEADGSVDKSKEGNWFDFKCDLPDSYHNCRAKVAQEADNEVKIDGVYNARSVSLYVCTEDDDVGKLIKEKSFGSFDGGELYAYVPPPPPVTETKSSDFSSLNLNVRYFDLTKPGSEATAADFKSLLNDIQLSITESGLANETATITKNMQADNVSSLNTEKLAAIRSDVPLFQQDEKSDTPGASRGGLPIEYPKGMRTFSRLPVLSDQQKSGMTGASIDTSIIEVPELDSLCFQVAQQLIVLMGAESLKFEQANAATASNTPVKVVVSKVRLGEKQVQTLLARGLTALAKPYGLTFHDGRNGPKLALLDSKFAEKGCGGLTDFFMCLNKVIKGLFEIKVHFDNAAYLGQMLASLLGVSAGVNDSLSTEHKSWSVKKLNHKNAIPQYGALFNGFQLIAAQTVGADKFIVSDLIDTNMAPTLCALFMQIAKNGQLSGHGVDGDEMDGSGLPDIAEGGDEGNEGQNGSGEEHAPDQEPDSSADNDVNSNGPSTSQSSLSTTALALRQMELNRGDFWRSIVGNSLMAEKRPLRPSNLSSNLARSVASLGRCTHSKGEYSLA